jgi:hypothetical protein
MLHQVWRLSEEGNDNLGLFFTKNGLILGSTPLIERRGERFVARDRSEIERLLARAYRDDSLATRIMSGLVTVASAMNANDPCLARIAAVHLRVPDLPDRSARDDLEAEDILIKSADWNPALHPRTGTPPNPGWFAPTDGSGNESSPVQTAANDDDPARRSDGSPSVGDNWVRLRPGPHRIDELADFVEWIANAEPEDQRAIRAEIKRYFYDVGDQGSADQLNAILTAALKPGIDTEERQQLLNHLDVFTRADPGEYVGTRDALNAAILAALALGGAPAVGDVPSPAWKLGWAARGNYFSEQLGANLPATFPVIDKWLSGVVTSIKSIDLNAATYQDAARLTYRLNDYIDQLALYDGGKMGPLEIDSSAISGRTLSLAIPKGSMTEIQRAAIDAATARAQAFEIDLIITPF